MACTTVLEFGADIISLDEIEEIAKKEKGHAPVHHSIIFIMHTG